MSKRINVNPGQYKVAGREHPGDGIVQAKEKQELRKADTRQEAMTRGREKQMSKGDNRQELKTQGQEKQTGKAATRQASKTPKGSAKKK